MEPLSTSAGIAPGCGHGRHVERAAFGPDLELLLEVAGRLDLDLVVGLRVDQVVEDRLVGVDLFGLARTQQVHLAGVFLRPARGALPLLLLLPLVIRRTLRRRAVTAINTATVLPHFICSPLMPSRRTLL